MSTLWHSWVLSTSKSSNSVGDASNKGFNRHSCQNDCMTSMIMVRIPVISLKFGIISNAYLVETWFFYLLGDFFKHFIRFQDLLMQFYLLTPSLVVKWILKFLPMSSSINSSTHHSILSIHHLSQHFSYALQHFSVGAIILVMKSVTIYHLLFSNYGLQEDFISPVIPSLVNIDSCILNDDLLLTSGLF